MPNSCNRAIIVSQDKSLICTSSNRVDPYGELKVFAGSASGSLSSIQQLAAGLGSAAVTSLFFHTASAGLDHAMTVSLVVVLALVAASLPAVALMPRKAPAGPHH